MTFGQPPHPWSFNTRTLVAYEVDESSGELGVNILGVYHDGQGWVAAINEDQSDPERT